MRLYDSRLTIWGNLCGQRERKRKRERERERELVYFMKLMFKSGKMMCWLLGQLIVEATRAERLCKSEPSWLNSGYIQWPKSNRPCVAGHHVPSRSIDWCFMDWMGPVFQTVGIFKLGAWDLWHVPLTWTTQPAACKCPFSQCQIELACRSVSHCDSAIRAIHMSRKQNQTRQN